VILDGAIVWPQHVQTNSHFYQSLLFNNLEVNAFGKERGGGKDEQIYCNDY
jgi:hypothetical protein